MTDRNEELNGSGDNRDAAIDSDTIDITILIANCAAFLSVQDPFFAHPNDCVFALQDAMAAAQILDLKMDSCEIPASQAAPLVASHQAASNELAALSTSNSPDSLDSAMERRIPPRPAPRGLHDPVVPLPWKDLTLDDAAVIGVQILVRFQALLDSSSVGESTFTCLYAHLPVVHDMHEQLVGRIEPSENMDEVFYTSSGSAAQWAVYAATRGLLGLTELVRGIITNADIYEEEDYVANASGLACFEPADGMTHEHVLTLAAQRLGQFDAESSTKTTKIVHGVFAAQKELWSVCGVLACLVANDDTTHTIAGSRKILQRLVQLLESLATHVRDNDMFLSSRVEKQAFDAFVNRPLLGNSPARKVSFRPAANALRRLGTIVNELHWALLSVLECGPSLSRLSRLMSRIGAADTNILSRSLLVLNLYFENLLLGRFNLRQLLIENMQEHMPSLPADYLKSDNVQTLLGRMVKPVYDTLKMLCLNRNRQRPFMEAIMLPDWTVLQNEAHWVETTLQHESNDNSTTPAPSKYQPFLSQYVLLQMIRLMDRHVSLGVELALVRNPASELPMSFWYRDFLLSAYLKNYQLMSNVAKAAGEPESSATKASTKKGKKGNKRNNSHSNKNGESAKSNAPKSMQQIENEFEVALIGLKRNICRGLIRFLAALRQVGILRNPEYEFTSLRRIFETRFELFELIQQPPPLSYDDYVNGMSFARISQSELVQSTIDWFEACQGTASQLLSNVTALDPVTAPTQPAELKAMVKYCLGNAVYVRKLQQHVESRARETAKPEAASLRVELDFDAACPEFCTIKLV